MKVAFHTTSLTIVEAEDMKAARAKLSNRMGWYSDKDDVLRAEDRGDGVMIHPIILAPVPLPDDMAPAERMAFEIITKGCTTPKERLDALQRAANSALKLVK